MKLRAETSLFSWLVIALSEGKQRQVALVGSFLQPVGDSSFFHLLKAISDCLNPSTVIHHKFLRVCLLLLGAPGDYFCELGMRAYELLGSGEEVDILYGLWIVFVEEDVIELIVVPGAGDSEFGLALRHSCLYLNYIDSLYFVELAINSQKIRALRNQGTLVVYLGQNEARM